MIFFTVVMLTFNLGLLIVGKSFQKLRSEFGEEEIKKSRIGIDNYKPTDEFMTKVVAFGFYSLAMSLLYVVYFSLAIAHDPYLYPTLVLLAYIILGVLQGFISKDNKIDLSTDAKIEKFRKKLNRKRSILGTVVKVVYISYFVYMLYFLIV